MQKGWSNIFRINKYIQYFSDEWLNQYLYSLRLKKKDLAYVWTALQIKQLCNTVQAWHLAVISRIVTITTKVEGSLRHYQVRSKIFHTSSHCSEISGKICCIFFHHAFHSPCKQMAAGGLRKKHCENILSKPHVSGRF